MLLIFTPHGGDVWSVRDCARLRTSRLTDIQPKNALFAGVIYTFDVRACVCVALRSIFMHAKKNPIFSCI